MGLNQIAMNMGILFVDSRIVSIKKCKCFKCQYTVLFIINTLSFYIIDVEKKKITNEQNTRLVELENGIRSFMEESINGINRQFGPLRKTISPFVDKLHVHLDVFPELESKNRRIANLGFINYNLCFNAQTAEKHTETDASYTIISVPTQLEKKINSRRKNSGRFELNINDEDTFVIPMETGTTFAYSGFLLTHRQQIHKFSEDAAPFINVVSYNSKRLFENMLQSFRRYLGDKELVE